MGRRAAAPRLELDPERVPYLHPEDVAIFFGIGRTAAYDAIRRGQIPSIRIGRTVLVPTAALRRLLAMDGPAGPLSADKVHSTRQAVQ